MVGFSVLPAGVHDAVLQDFSLRGEYSAFWTSSDSEIDAQNAVAVDFSYDQHVPQMSAFIKKTHGYSIRCLKD